jgi:nicotinate phosphoribosyltransferase
MDIIEVDGKPLAKRGKWSGSKRVLRCQKCHVSRVVPNDNKKHRCLCGGKFIDILVPFSERGNILQKPLPARDIRSFVLEQVEKLEL